MSSILDSAYEKALTEVRQRELDLNACKTALLTQVVAEAILGGTVDSLLQSIEENSLISGQKAVGYAMAIQDVQRLLQDAGAHLPSVKS